MKNYLNPVFKVTAFLIIYVVSIQVNLYLPLLMFMFSISPLLLIWMVYKILTAKEKVDETFEEKWYEDSKGKG
jgi:hypothetical protein